MKIHGEWQISLVRNVVIQTIAGAFNEEGARARSLELRGVAPLDQPWAILGNSSNWDMGTPATLKIVEETRDWSLLNGCVCIATVVPDSFRRSVHQENTRKLPSDVLKYCTTLEEACTWLSTRGFPILPEHYPHQAFLERSRLT